jgi:2-iminoacetate synthase ThiH
MNIKQELHKELLAFLNKVADQSYTTREWEYFALNNYQDELMESVREEMVDLIKRALKNGEGKPFSKDMKSTIQQLIHELEDMSI